MTRLPISQYLKNNEQAAINLKNMNLPIRELTSLKNIFQKRYNIRLSLLMASLLVVATLSYVFGKTSTGTVTPNTPPTALAQTSDLAKVSPPAPKSTFPLNQEQTFSIVSNGKKLGEFKYLLESAMLQDTIIVKGQQLSAVSGKVFLIMNLKITNPTQKEISVNTRDYLRVFPESSTDPLASDIHNDPIIVQALSAKEARLGFVVDQTAKNFHLNFGEISGPKKELEVKF